MYNISEEVKQLYISGARQVATLSVNGIEEEISIDESVIKSLSVSRQSVSGNRISFGTTVSHQLNLVLRNDGEFSLFKFEGAEIFLQIGVVRPSDKVKLYMPCGYFIVDEPTRPLKEITIKSLDRMMLFEKPVGDEFYTWFPCSAKTLLSNICSTCNVTLKTDVNSFPNSNFVIQNAPVADDLTYRQVLIWVCELLGKCAYFDWEGALVLDFYHSTNDIEIDESLRFSSDVLENEIRITGIKAITEEKDYLYGQEDYTINIEGNMLLQGTDGEISTVLQNIARSIFTVGENYGVNYYPMSCDVLSMPFLYPMDGVEFIRESNSVHSILTSVSFSLNKETSLKSVGETTQNASYASQNPLTARENVIINKIKNEMNETLNRKIQSVLELNDLVANTMGFWRTTETLSDGSQILYIHDHQTLEESKSVWRMSGQVFSWTDDYQGAGTTWQSGISAGGNAWFRYVSAIGLTLSSASDDWYSEFTPNAWFIKKGEMYAMQVDNTTGEVRMVIPKLIIDNPGTSEIDGYIEVGKVRLQPFSVNGVCVGGGFIQVD